MGHVTFDYSIISVIEFQIRVPTHTASVKATQVKHLEGLLSCNDDNLVIVDDRDDVWENSPNVLKLFPCEYTPVGMRVLFLEFLTYDTDVLLVAT